MLALTVMCLCAHKNEKITLLFLCTKVVITGTNQRFLFPTFWYFNNETSSVRITGLKSP